MTFHRNSLVVVLSRWLARCEVLESLPGFWHQGVERFYAAERSLSQRVCHSRPVWATRTSSTHLRRCSAIPNNHIARPEKETWEKKFPDRSMSIQTSTRNPTSPRHSRWKFHNVSTGGAVYLRKLFVTQFVRNYGGCRQANASHP